MSEQEFWMSTVDEIIKRSTIVEQQKREELKQRAIFDYKLADLIGISVARIYGNTKYPDIEVAYPSLFELNQEEKQKELDELSAARFREFAQAYNDKLKEAD